MINVRVSDIMVYLDEYPAMVLNTATIRDAIRVMQETQLDIHGKKSLPRIVIVISPEDHIVGMVRRRDIFRGLEPRFMSESGSLEYRKKLFDVKVDPNLAEMSLEGMLKNIKKRADRPITDVMFRNIITIDYDDHVLKAIHVLVDNDISMLPVMNNNKVVGIVRSVELFDEIAKYV